MEASGIERVSVTPCFFVGCRGRLRNFLVRRTLTGVMRVRDRVARIAGRAETNAIPGRRIASREAVERCAIDLVDFDLAGNHAFAFDPSLVVRFEISRHRRLSCEQAWVAVSSAGESSNQEWHEPRSGSDDLLLESNGFIRRRVLRR